MTNRPSPPQIPLNGKAAAVSADEEPMTARQTLWTLAAIIAIEVSVGSAVVNLTKPSPAVSSMLAQSSQPAALQAPVMLAVADDPSMPDAERVARWAASSGNAERRPFIVVDKKNARVTAYDAAGQATHTTPALMGSAIGDDSVPGIGERKIEDILPHERITPAGRFVAQQGTNLNGEDILWVDYDAAVSMHRVRTTNPHEQRLQRLRTETIADNRISWGCINLPAPFYDSVIKPLINESSVVVYVLPETRSLTEVFALGQPAAQQVAASLR